jgi:hypothetical protein
MKTAKRPSSASLTTTPIEDDGAEAPRQRPLEIDHTIDDGDPLDRIDGLAVRIVFRACTTSVSLK